MMSGVRRSRTTKAFFAVAGVAAALVAPAGAAAKPTISVSPASVQPGGSVVLSGRGWTPGRAVSLKIGPPRSDALTSLGTTKASRAGRLRKRVRLSSSQAPGSYVVLACRLRCRSKATARLRVTAPSAGMMGGTGGTGSSMGSAGSATVFAGPGAAQLGYLTTSVMVPAGGSLTFTNYDILQHDVTSDERAPDGGPLFSTPLIGTGQSATAEGLDRLQPGHSYGFFCSLHANMRGTLVVG
jgi:plastocyanin